MAVCPKEENNSLPVAQVRTLICALSDKFGACENDACKTSRKMNAIFNFNFIDWNTEANIKIKTSTRIAIK
jgi:hypothetical protein